MLCIAFIQAFFFKVIYSSEFLFQIDMSSQICQYIFLVKPAAAK